MNESVSEQMRRVQAQHQLQERKRRQEETRKRVAREDAARAERVKREIAEDERVLKERRAALQWDLEQRNAQEAARLKEEVRVRFMTSPGATASEFERRWPEILRQIQTDHALGGQTTAEEYATYRHRVGVGRVD